LAGLRKVLHLAQRPRTIEGVDIAHIAGTETVAAVVQFLDGLPFKPGYKRMKIRSVAGPDDVASIHEAVLRRFRHVSESERAPDILLIDGGKGQLHAAMAALAAAGQSQQKVIALAKREELVFTPEAEEPLALSRHSYALRLLQYVRDEAHRFAQHYHHLLRRRSQLGEEER
jgi:excinuclease ABC subunit C